MNAEQTFRSKSSGIVAKLLGDFPIHNDDGFAIVGNLGHECAGFTKLQEIKPTVKGSRGGYGWPQWTGPRRRAYEAYCKRNHLDPASDEANYAYLFVELKGSEARAIPATLKVTGLRSKAVAFEGAFLRAGVKHYDLRLTWARIAEAEWQNSGQAPAPMPAQRKRDILVEEGNAVATRSAQAAKQGTGVAGSGTVAGGTGIATGGTSDVIGDLVLLGVTAALVGAGAWLLWRAWKQRGVAKRLLAAAVGGA